MTAKPTTLPTWATDAGATLEPPAGQKATGFGSGEQPSPRRFNWLFNTNYQWCSFINDLFGAGATGDMTLTGDQAGSASRAHGNMPSLLSSDE